MNRLLLYAVSASINLFSWFMDGSNAVAIDLDRECAIAVSYSDNLGWAITTYDRDQPSHNRPGWLTFRVDQFNYTLHGDMVGNTWVATQLEDPETALVVHALKHGRQLSVYKDGEQIGNFPLEGSARCIRLAYQK